MTESKTTILRGKKKEQLRQAIDNLVYFALNTEKRHLRLIRESDMKEVLKITTGWKTGLIEFQKIYENSNTKAQDGDAAIEG
jgi:hypothetical protein